MTEEGKEGIEAVGGETSRQLGLEETPQKGTKPSFTVKEKNGGYVGSGWVNDGKFGKYLSLAINQPVAKGATLYVYNRKDSQATIALQLASAL
ncbi:MAG: hypothetical protein AABW54_03865 [Candidatus Micrarchaeota archaeon]